MGTEHPEKFLFLMDKSTLFILQFVKWFKIYVERILKTLFCTKICTFRLRLLYINFSHDSKYVLQGINLKSWILQKKESGHLQVSGTNSLFDFKVFLKKMSLLKNFLIETSFCKIFLIWCNKVRLFEKSRIFSNFCSVFNNLFSLKYFYALWKKVDFPPITCKKASFCTRNGHF